jgi:hypothetical protein
MVLMLSPHLFPSGSPHLPLISAEDESCTSIYKYPKLILSSSYQLILIPDQLYKVIMSPFCR